MAIYRLSADIVRRSEGRTVTAAAAYRAGELIIDQRTGLAFDYRRRQGVLETLILAPDDVPVWIRDRVQLWNAVEAAEKRKDAQLARDIELALPYELSAGARRELVERFARLAFVDAGMVADIAMHAPDARGDGRNFHAHILLTMRRIAGDQFGDKEREWNKPEQLEHWRSLWAELVNEALEIAGDQARVDHRSLEAQGIERMPQIHLGLAVTEMRRRGITTERAELAGAIDAVNDELTALPIEGCNGGEPAPLPSVLCNNTPLALLPTPARTDRPSLFRRASRELARRVTTPAPKPRRRRRDETRGAFRAAGTMILRQIAALPAVMFLADTLDWLNLWHQDAGDELTAEPSPNHLSPQP
jgi:hypothetical protein